MKLSKVQKWFSRLRSGELLEGRDMLKTIISKLMSRKFIALVGSITASTVGESLIESFPSWIICVLGIVYILGNVAQKFLLGWLELLKERKA